ATLSESRRALFERERDSLLAEARALARKVLLANYDKVFIPLGVEVAEKGILYTEDLQKFYKDHEANTYIEGAGTLSTRLSNTSWTSILARLSPYIYRRVSRDAELL